MTVTVNQLPPPRTFTVSLENRKRRGCGHERAAEILSAARALFLEHGVENVTTRQIAARVGISQTALYVYFTNKEQMLDVLAEETWRLLGSKLDAVAKKSAAEDDEAKKLRAILVAFVRFWLDRLDDYRIVFMRRALRPCAVDGRDPVDKCEEEGNGLLTRLTQSVETAVKQGSMRQFGCPATTALAIWGAVSGLITLRLVYPEFPWAAEDERIEATLDMVFNGCGSAKSAAATKDELVAAPIDVIFNGGGGAKSADACEDKPITATIDMILNGGRGAKSAAAVKENG